MYQDLTLVGNLGSEVEMRYTPGGVPVASFSLAVNRKWTDNDGQAKEKVTWFRVTCWKKQAEIVSEHLHKGSKVMVKGEIEEARPYTDRDGNARASLEVTAQRVIFLDSRAGNGTGPKDDDIPFN